MHVSHPGRGLAALTTARHRLLPVLAAAILASLMLAAPAAHAADCAGADALPVLTPVSAAKAATLCLLNDERTSRGLAALRAQSTLEAAAQSYSQAMVAQGFFGHVSPSGETIVDRLASYVGATGTWATGENLAWGSGPLATPAAIVKGWMESAGHRANILDADFAEIGVGIAAGSPQGVLPAAAATYVTEFGSRTPAAGAPSVQRASASAAPPALAKRVSAKTKRQIRARCHRVARRAKGSKKARAARYNRCVSKAMRAAAR
jgi:uncharacterized protein YkwD